MAACSDLSRRYSLFLFKGDIIDVCFSCLTAQVFRLELIALTVFDKMGSALAEGKRHILADALPADILCLKLYLLYIQEFLSVYL